MPLKRIFTKKRLPVFLIVVILLIGVMYAAFIRLSPEDCTSLEKYDNLTGACYYECDSDKDCADKERKVNAELDKFFADSQTKQANASQSAPKTPTSNDGRKLLDKEFTGSDTKGTIYTVKADASLAPKPSNRDDQLWQLFSRVAGEQDVKKYVQSFEVFDDSNNDSAASVWQSQTAGKWHVNVNAAYMDDKKDLAHTMIHEYGHIVSLNNTQVNGSTYGRCPAITLSEGCAEKSSYINTFYNAYWKQYGSDVPANDGQDQDEVDDFYDQQKQSFVSQYAATNYTEDWAETWAVFITRAKPTGKRVADQKMQSFYTYPALISERDRIRNQIANSL